MTRVLLRALPPILHDILSHALTREANVELVAEPVEMSPRPIAVPPDVIVGTEDAEDPAWAQAVLGRWPDSRVLLIAGRGHQTSLFELHPHRTALGEMSLDELVQVVTRVALERRRTFETWQ